MTRALVLGGGGTTGIAWGAASSTPSPTPASTSTRPTGWASAGALVGAFLCLGFSPRELATTLVDNVRDRTPRPRRRPSAGLVARSAAIGRSPSGAWPRRAQRLGLSEDAFVDDLAHLVGRGWPDRLVVTTVNAATGGPVILDAAAGVDLGIAVAASCSVPGVFPPVTIDGVPHVDGGVRSPANVDLADDADAVIALAPFHQALDPARRPGAQARQLPARTGWLYVRPDATARRAIGLDALSAARREGAREPDAARSAPFSQLHLWILRLPIVSLEALIAFVPIAALIT